MSHMRGRTGGRKHERITFVLFGDSVSFSIVVASNSLVFCFLFLSVFGVGSLLVSPPPSKKNGVVGEGRVPRQIGVKGFCFMVRVKP